MTSLKLDAGRQRAYFSRPGGISDWWQPEQGAYRHHYARQLAILREQLQIPPQAQVADLGTGQGRFARFFAHEGAHVTAVDVSADMLAIAHDRAREEGVEGRIDFAVDTVEGFLAGRPPAYDIICLMEVLDHLADPAETLALCARALRPGGQLLLTYVSQSSLYGRLASLVLPRARRGDLTIARPYPPRQVAAWLQASGLTFRSFGVGLFAFITRETLLPPLAGVLGALCRLEGHLKPYYRQARLVRHCVHVVTLARRPLR